VRPACAGLGHNRSEPTTDSPRIQDKEIDMASSQQPDQNQQSTRQGDSLSGSIQTPGQGVAQGSSQSGNQGGSEQRSEGLLPADGADDGRFDVAEEVSLDQQSDKMRHVGQAPAGGVAENVDDDPDAAADDVLPDPGNQSDG
jgi:hypothetical protein